MFSPPVKGHLRNWENIFQLYLLHVSAANMQKLIFICSNLRLFFTFSKTQSSHALGDKATCGTNVDLMKM